MKIKNPKIAVVSVFRCFMLFTLLLQSFESDAAIRVANQSLNLPLNPPSFGYVTTLNITDFWFNRPVVLASPPGEDSRLFIVQQSGVIWVFPDEDRSQKLQFMNISRRRKLLTEGEQGLLGLAFHPDFQENGYFFISYTVTSTTDDGTGRHDRVSRFRVSDTNPNQADLDSELILIDQFDQASNHNGGDLHFGPDGYLYISLGDEGGANDQFDNSQRITRDFFSGILRIDVDKRPGNLKPNPHPANSENYWIPADNPFISVTEFNGRPVNPEDVLTEFYAVGLRNPWRMSFDSLDGRLWVGDVGQGAREEIDIIVKGGNYGWDIREGTIPTPGKRRPPFAFEPIEPIWEYGRSSGKSVTGGLVYRGDRFPELFGVYLFCDYASGNIWGLRELDDGQVRVDRIAREGGIVAFGVDPVTGDILLADYGEGRIKMLQRADPSGGEPIPERLSHAGIFSDMALLKTHPGIEPYDLVVPFWSDGAEKTRWFSIPNPDDRIVFNETGNWEFPLGSVWVKHFELEMVEGEPESRKRIETRALVLNEQGSYGVTYRWGDSMEDALLVPEEGMTETFEIQSGDQTRSQTWIYPSRSGCLTCHTPQTGHVLGFRTEQLNRMVSFDNAKPVNQIQRLHEVGYFVNPPESIHTLPALAPLDDTSAGLEYRVRSYLAANCAHCHLPNGLGRGLFDARFNSPISLSGLIHGDLIQTPLDSEVGVVVPGDVGKSSSNAPDRK
ncbi:MAG TPA: hypothetical protein EYQ50_13830 [Verrucomicrobiales bacterium]|nr:hypothetical protein [Verrucomicrobiales bacterium]